MIISIIAAVAENNVIGKDNDLVWHLPNDTRYFMDTTKGHHILTGRRNYESIPPKYRPLKDRINVIVTRQPNYQVVGAIVVNSIEDGIERAQNNGEEELFIIGGGEIYHQSLDLVDRLYITEVKDKFEGDTYFPKVDYQKWKEVKRVHNPNDNKHAYAFDFVIWEKDHSIATK